MDDAAWAEAGLMLRGVLGYGVFFGVAIACSVNRRAISRRVVLGGIGLQVLAAWLILRFPPVRAVVEAVGRGLVALMDFTREGTIFVFGWLAMEPKSPPAFALTLLPMICVLCALAAGLQYLRVLPWLVAQLAKVTTRVMGVSGAESLSAAANIFLGQTEAPLLIRPWLATLPISGLLAVMIGGMASIAAGVLVVYAVLLGGDDPSAQARFAMHLLAASVMSAPAGLMVAKILWPDEDAVDLRIRTIPPEGVNLIDALCAGTVAGLKLAVNVAAMLIVFTALVALVNHLLAAGPGEWFGLNAWMCAVTGGTSAGLSVQGVLGLVFAPVAWLMGIDSSQVLPAGALLGEKLVLNEFFAYVSLSQPPMTELLGDERAKVILAYALCGFANVASVGIQVGGFSALVPERRADFARLGSRALLGGSLVTCMNACVAGLLVG